LSGLNPIFCFAGLSGWGSTMQFSTLRAFLKDRDRLLTTEIAQAFLAALLALPEVKRLLSAEHFFRSTARF
jgi:hypothetical protein